MTVTNGLENRPHTGDPAAPEGSYSGELYLRFALDLVLDGKAGRLDEPTIHPPMLRRIVGKALIDRFCPHGRPLCESQRGGSGPPEHPRDRCPLAEACPYGVLFAASCTRRPPYAFFTRPGGGSRGTSRVELTLFGPAWRHYPWILAALDAALRRGVGKERRSWCVRRALRLRPGGRAQQVAGTGLAGLIPNLAPDLLEVAPNPDSAPGPVTVHFLSPSRLLHKGRLVPGRAPVPFQVLIERILDRFADLYGPGASAILHPESRDAIQPEAVRVPVLDDDTRWIEVPDYSARSRSEMLLGGKVGRTVYGAGAAHFLPILRAGEILHVGKNAAAGNGRIAVEPGDSHAH